MALSRGGAVIAPRSAAVAALLVLGCRDQRVPDVAPPAAPLSSEAQPRTEGFVTTPDSVRLWYRVVGTGPETVIVPGALYHRNKLDGLATLNRRLVLYDSRGRGKSDSVPAAKTGLDRDLADVDAISRAVSADSFAVIAWSGLGMELFTYGVRNPSRMTRLVLLASVGPRWDPYWEDMRTNGRKRTNSTAAAALEARVKAGEFAHDEPGLCREQAKLSYPTLFVDSALARQAPDVCDSPNEWPGRYGIYVGRLLASFGKFDLRSDLAKMSRPTLVIHGEQDNIPLAASREWATGLPNARLLVVKGAAHWPHVEKPDQVIPAIRAFLDGGWPVEAQQLRKP